MEGQVTFQHVDILLQEVMSAEWNIEFTSRTSPQYIML